MEFYPTNEYREVTLQAGLNSIQLGNTDGMTVDDLLEECKQESNQNFRMSI